MTLADLVKWVQERKSFFLKWEKWTCYNEKERIRYQSLIEGYSSVFEKLEEITMNLPDIEAVSAKVHEQWMETKYDQGVYSRLSETGEELMVDYHLLSEPAKDLDRNTVKTIYKAIQELS
jgi:hypothetical protein